MYISDILFILFWILFLPTHYYIIWERERDLVIPLKLLNNILSYKQNHMSLIRSPVYHHIGCFQYLATCKWHYSAYPMYVHARMSPENIWLPRNGTFWVGHTGCTFLNAETLFICSSKRQYLHFSGHVEWYHFPHILTNTSCC
jgi:hypothetical protein